MNVAFQRNIGSFLRAAAAFNAAANVTAGGGADGVAQNGVTIDREAFVPLALSGMLVLQLGGITLDTDESVEVALSMQDSADGVNWDALDVGPPDGVATAVVTGEDVPTVVTRKVQLGAARRYVRARYTLTFSAANTDNVDVLGGVLIVGGFDELPADARVEVGVSS